MKRSFETTYRFPSTTILSPLCVRGGSWNTPPSARAGGGETTMTLNGFSSWSRCRFSSFRFFDTLASVFFREAVSTESTTLSAEAFLGGGEGEADTSTSLAPPVRPEMSTLSELGWKPRASRRALTSSTWSASERLDQPSTTFPALVPAVQLSASTPSSVSTLRASWRTSPRRRRYGIPHAQTTASNSWLSKGRVGSALRSSSTELSSAELARS
mmetsp:Transcript_10052/g.24603  ORF Transcript_10052/g.24603 Transcript_10052/m.24603 type:complete len:214 (+) Transcript_10052:137-778(+)